MHLIIFSNVTTKIANKMSRVTFDKSRQKEENAEDFLKLSDRKSQNMYDFFK